jgi:hypothetical protein
VEGLGAKYMPRKLQALVFKIQHQKFLTSSKKGRKEIKKTRKRKMETCTYYFFKGTLMDIKGCYLLSIKTLVKKSVFLLPSWSVTLVRPQQIFNHPNTVFLKVYIFII